MKLAVAKMILRENENYEQPRVGELVEDLHGDNDFIFTQDMEDNWQELVSAAKKVVDNNQ